VYIEAYKHFVTACRKIAPAAQFVWSPAGEQGSENYWPGSAYVDYIGISVYEYDAWNVAQGLAPRSFTQIAKPKLSRMAKFNKAIIVAEMGVTGTESFKVNWLSAIRTRDLASPNLVGFVYFNSKDVDGAWGSTLPTPDWRLSPAGLQVFSALAVQ
jgi:beta-mannanase